LIPDGDPAAWAEPDHWPELGGGELRLWFAPLDLEDGRQQELRASLSEAERARAARFVFDLHRRRYAAGRGLLRQLLGRYLDLPPAALAFDTGPLGKPYLGGAQRGARLQFNYSDADGMALYGFALDAELGVDLESLAREVGHQEIARRHFRAEEVAALERGEPAESRAAFLACWTRKEAWGKAKGVGIHYPLDGIDLCSRIAEATLNIRDAGAPEDWTITQLRPAPAYIGAVACAGGPRVLRGFRYPKWQT
jgi:4'-phosphopantetheinyl transferase